MTRADALTTALAMATMAVRRPNVLDKGCSKPATTMESIQSRENTLIHVMNRDSGSITIVGAWIHCVCVCRQEYG